MLEIAKLSTFGALAPDIPYITNTKTNLAVKNWIMVLKLLKKA